MSLDLPDWSIAQWEELICWIDDYCTRFIVTCPEDDMNSVMRALEKTREAFWLFTDDTIPRLLQQKGMDFTFIDKNMHIYFFLTCLVYEPLRMRVFELSEDEALPDFTIAEWMSIVDFLKKFCSIVNGVENNVLDGAWNVFNIIVIPMAMRSGIDVGKIGRPQFNFLMRLATPKLRTKVFGPRINAIMNGFKAILETVDCCGAMLVSPDKKAVVLIKPAKHIPWAMPKGKLQEREDKFTCALREVKEEIGVDIDPGTVNRELCLTVEDEKKYTSLFVITIPKDTKFRAQEHEVDKVKFFPVKAIMSGKVGTTKLVQSAVEAALIQNYVEM